MTNQEKEELEKKLKRQLDAGEITAEEADMEWQDAMNPEPRYCGQEW